MEIYFRLVSKVVDEKRTKKPRKLPIIRGSTGTQGPRTWLKYDEEKGMVCEWRVEDKQTLVACTECSKLQSGFVQVLENLESPGILLWHFPGLESPGKRPLVLESSGNLLTQLKI